MTGACAWLAWLRVRLLQGTLLLSAAGCHEPRPHAAACCLSRLIMALPCCGGQGVYPRPVLVQVKLLAEPWDCGGLYQVGSFPNWDVWGEWNGRFRDDVRWAARSQPLRLAGVQRA